MCQFFCHAAVTYDAPAYLRHPSVVCLIQASKSCLVSLLAFLYDFLYVHQKHTVSISIDTTFPKRLHRNHNYFLYYGIIFYRKRAKK